MKAKRLSLAALAVLLAAAGGWLARSATRSNASRPTGPVVGVASTNGQASPGHALLPPDPLRRFTDLTPEQRVRLARQGHGPGG